MSDRYSDPSAEIVLVRQQAQQKASKVATWIALALMLVMVGVTAFVFAGLSGNDPEAWQRLWHKLSARPDNLVLGLIALGMSLYQALVLMPVMAKQRIVINRDGIAFQSPRSVFVPSFWSGWSMPWNRIRKAESKFLPGVLVLRDEKHVRRIILDAWGEADAVPERLADLFRARLRRPTSDELWARFEASPIVRALRAHRIDIAKPGGAAVFDLAKNPRTLAVTVLALALGIYGAADAVLISETYADRYPWSTWVAAGLVAAVLAHRWMSAAKVPAVVTFSLALFLGAAMALAAFPALLRINQLTDTGGIQAHDYLLREPVRLDPVEANLPVIEFGGYPEYWQQFSPGSRHVIHLRKGGLGFWQVDLAPLHSSMRDFYESYYARSRPADRR